MANTQIACAAALCRFNQQGALCTLAEIIIQPQHGHPPAGGAGREVHPYCASFDPQAAPR